VPAGPIGSCWATGSWSDTAWEALTWQDAVALAFILDLNLRLYRYLCSHFSVSSGDLTSLVNRHLDAQTSGDRTQRFHALIQEATDAMS
jgi:hypothetical protein